MKKVLFFFVFLSISSLLSIVLVMGYATSNLNKEQQYLLDGENISFALSNVWQEEDNTTYDLSLTKLNSNLHFLVFKKLDINMAAEELLNSKIKEELSDKDSYSLIKKYNTNKTKNRTIYSKLYLAMQDNIEDQYLFSVIEFDDSDTYVFVVYTAKGAYMQYSIDDIQRLLIKMEWNGTETELVYNWSFFFII